VRLAQPVYQMSVFLTKLFLSALKLFLWLCGRRVNEKTHWFFSRNLSRDRLSQPEKPFRSSHKTFLADEKNAVCAILAHKKCGKSQPRKVMRERAPLLLLIRSNAAKSIMRKDEKLSEKCH
jgi:hypothetical protein